MKLLKKNIFDDKEYNVAETVLSGGDRTFEHEHDFYEIFLTTEGHAAHRLNGAERVLEINTLFFIRPSDSHGFSVGSGGRARFTNIAFTADIYEKAKKIFFEQVGGEASFRPSVLLTDDLARVIKTKLEILSRGFKGGRTNEKALVLNLLSDCFIWLYEGGDDESDMPPWLREACLEMRRPENLSGGIRRFVALCGRTQEHLTRTLKACRGVTPSVFLNKLRLERVCYLLKTTDDGVLDIMIACGFNSASHFNRLFKEEYGMTPSRYRVQNRAVFTGAGGKAE